MPVVVPQIFDIEQIMKVYLTRIDHASQSLIHGDEDAFKKYDGLIRHAHYNLKMMLDSARLAGCDFEKNEKIQRLGRDLMKSHQSMESRLTRFCANLKKDLSKLRTARTKLVRYQSTRGDSPRFFREI